MEGQETCPLTEDAALAAAGPAGGAGVRVRREPDVAGLGVAALTRLSLCALAGSRGALLRPAQTMQRGVHDGGHSQQGTRQPRDWTRGCRACQTVAFLVATAALDQGKQVVIWATKDAVRLGLPGEATGVACKGCPPLERLFEQFADGGGELWLCPICVAARDLDDAEKVSKRQDRGCDAQWEWAG